MFTNIDGTVVKGNWNNDNLEVPRNGKDNSSSHSSSQSNEDSDDSDNDIRNLLRR